MIKCSIPLDIMEMQTKTTMSYSYTVIKMAIIIYTGNIRGWQWCGATRLCSWWEYKMVQLLWGKVLTDSDKDKCVCTLWSSKCSTKKQKRKPTQRLANEQSKRHYSQQPRLDVNQMSIKRSMEKKKKTKQCISIG